MKLSSLFLGIVLLGTTTAARVDAQQPATPKDPHHPETPAASAPSTQPGQSAPTSGGMMPMEMCHQMMMSHMMGGGMMGGGMMGMPTGGDAQKMDPKTMAQMMEMRGEMMKAMGDIMMKHARKMQSAPR
jgi:hypothetical protein